MTCGRDSCCLNLSLNGFDALGGSYTKNALQHHIPDHSQLFGRLRKSCIGYAPSQKRAHIPRCTVGNMAAYGNSFRAGCIYVRPRCEILAKDLIIGDIQPVFISIKREMKKFAPGHLV